MDPFLNILIFSIYTISAIVLFFLAAIIFLRLKAAREEKAYRLCEKEWEALYLDYILGKAELGDVKDQFLKNKRYNFYQRFFTPYLEMLDGKDFEATKELCREISIIGYYRKKLLKRNLYDRATAAKMLGDFRCRRSIPQRIRMLKNKNHLLVLAAAQGLALSNNPRAFRPVLKALLSNTYFTYEGTTEILSRFGREICEPITKQLDDYSRGNVPAAFKPPREKKNKGFRNLLPKAETATINHGLLVIILIDLLGHYHYMEALPVLNRLLERADTETIVHIMKAFLRIGKLPEAYKPGPYLGHEDWVIRNFAIQTTELKPNETLIPMLTQLLDDNHWWVRYHAAKAMLAIGDAGSSVLARQADGTETKAATIAAYVLAAKEVS
jgi:hypothetical protein